MGELTVRVRTEQQGAKDVVSKVRFQGARVRKPLLAVSGIVDKKNLVAFDDAGSFVIPSSAPELPRIRGLLQRVKGRIPLHKKNGVFVMKVWEHDDAVHQQQRQSGFIRPAAA